MTFAKLLFLLLYFAIHVDTFYILLGYWCLGICDHVLIKSRSNVWGGTGSFTVYLSLVNEKATSTKVRFVCLSIYRSTVYFI